MTIQVGEPPSSSKYIQISTKEQFVRIPNNVDIRKYDFVTKTNKDMMKPSELAPYRLIGDPLVDDVLTELDLKPDQDILQVVKEHVSSPNPKPAVVKFWTQIHELPPKPINAAFFHHPNTTDQNTHLSPFKSYLTAGNVLLQPNLASGMGVFWRYAFQILDALLHYSLAVGFSSPLLLHVLHRTNYLTSSNRDVTFRRLNETVAWVFDAMTDMTPGSGVGWESTIRVRCLHGRVRSRLLKQDPNYNIQKWGVPINQEDMATTLAGFMITPIWAMFQSKVSIRPDQMDAYRAAWCHIGYYLGVDAKILSEKYARSWQTAESFFVSLIIDIFPDDDKMPEETTSNILSVLNAVVDRKPEPYDLNKHIALSRVFIGDFQATILKLPKPSLLDNLFIYFRLYLKRGLLKYGSLHPEWEVQRQFALQHALPLYALRVLGHYAHKASSTRPKKNPYARQIYPLQNLPIHYTLDKNNPLDEVEESYRQQYMGLMKNMGKDILTKMACVSAAIGGVFWLITKLSH